VTDRTSERGKMSLDAAINNLRRTLEARNHTQVKKNRAANSQLLVVQVEAVIREYDKMKADERALVYQLPRQLGDA
jgi:hypothetical protein